MVFTNVNVIKISKENSGNLLHVISTIKMEVCYGDHSKISDV